MRFTVRSRRHGNWSQTSNPVKVVESIPALHTCFQSPRCSLKPKQSATIAVSEFPMDWGSDLEIASKKLIPRLGRRAAQNNGNEDARSDDDALDSPGSFSSGKSARQTTLPVAPPRTRKTGWGDELKSGKTKVANIIEQERFKPRENDEEDDEIPVIPDLDEIQVDTGMAEITNVASVGINRVAAYKELDKDLLRNEAFAFLDGVNLALLTDKLYPDKSVRETDETWTWDLLFTQVSSELNSEAQRKLDS